MMTITQDVSPHETITYVVVHWHYVLVAFVLSMLLSFWLLRKAFREAQ